MANTVSIRMAADFGFSAIRLIVPRGAEGLA
jgi:hypothetical protein